MSDFLDNKDYSDYFKTLENSLENKKVAPEKRLEPKREVIQKKKTIINKKILLGLAAVVLIAAIVFSIVAIASSKRGGEQTSEPGITAEDNNEIIRAVFDSKTEKPSEEIESKHIIVINRKTRKIVAERESDVRISPASTTKIMTMLVACENVTDFNDTFTMPIEITDAVFLEGATAAGFKIGEEVSVTDMLYGCILPSGGDAALGLAYKISGSEEAFVKLMNKKAKDLRLKDTHFTNVTGLYGEEHYTTAADLAVILEAAMVNPFCRKLLSTYEYTTAKTQEHPEGITFTSTLFSSMYGTEPETAQILGGKTGFVNESGYCIASYGKSNTDTEYICVTMDATSLVPSVKDQIALYRDYAK